MNISNIYQYLCSPKILTENNVKDGQVAKDGGDDHGGEAKVPEVV